MQRHQQLGAQTAARQHNWWPRPSNHSCLYNSLNSVWEQKPLEFRNSSTSLFSLSSVQAVKTTKMHIYCTLPALYCCVWFHLRVTFLWHPIQWHKRSVTKEGKSKYFSRPNWKYPADRSMYKTWPYFSGLEHILSCGLSSNMHLCNFFSWWQLIGAEPTYRVIDI